MCRSTYGKPVLAKMYRGNVDGKMSKDRSSCRTWCGGCNGKLSTTAMLLHAVVTENCIGRTCY